MEQLKERLNEVLETYERQGLLTKPYEVITEQTEKGLTVRVIERPTIDKIEFNITIGDK